MSNPSKRATALADLAARLAWITIEHGYNSDAGEHIFLGEQPSFGPDDPPAAIAIVIGDDAPVQAGPTIRSTVPVEVCAYVPADLDAPLLALEALIADIKCAVEIEGNDQNAIAGGSASQDRSLEGTLPKGLDRGVTRAIPRAEGSTVVGMSVEYRLSFEERWGKPGAELTLFASAFPNVQIVEQPVQFSAHASGGTPPYSYAWDFGNPGPWIPRPGDLYAHWPLSEASGTRRKTLGSALVSDMAEVGGAVPTAAGEFGLAVASTEGATTHLQGTITPVDLSGGFTLGIRFWMPPFASNSPKSMFSLGTGGIIGFPLIHVARFYGSNFLECSMSWAPNVGVYLPLPRLGPFATNAWHELVLWYDPVAGTFNGQVDGLPPWDGIAGPPYGQLSAPIAPADAALFTALDTLNLAGKIDGNFVSWDGRLADVDLWPVVLTADERAILWTNRSVLQNPRYSYPAAGSFSARCTAEDAEGDTVTRSVSVVVTP